MVYHPTPVSSILYTKITELQTEINEKLNLIKTNIETSGRLPRELDAVANELPRLFDNMNHLLSGTLECPQKDCDRKYRSMPPLREHIEQTKHRPEYGWRCEKPPAAGRPGKVGKCGAAILGHDWKKVADHYMSVHGMQGARLWEAQQEFVNERPLFWCHFCADFGPPAEAWLPHCAIYHNGRLGQVKDEAVYLSGFAVSEAGNEVLMEVDKA